MTEERKDQLVLSLFPLMIQAIYNARKMLDAYSNGTPQIFKDGETIATIVDLKIILKAFESVGIFNRYGVKKGEKIGDDTLKHFNFEDVDTIVADFNPDQIERDYEIENLKGTIAQLRKKLKEMVESITLPSLLPKCYVGKFIEKCCKAEEAIEEAHNVVENMNYLVGSLSRGSMTTNEECAKFVEDNIGKLRFAIAQANGFSSEIDKIKIKQAKMKMEIEEV